MKIRMFILSLLILASTAAAQPLTKSKHCPAANLSADTLLFVCRHEGGMAPLIQPRLYFKLDADGGGEFEIDVEGGLATKRKRLSKTELADLKKLIASPEMKNAEVSYPEYRNFTDSSTKTRIVMRIDGKEKAILLRNFSPDVPGYPKPVVELMQTLERLRGEAPELIEQPPLVSFEGMLSRPEYLRREVSIYAYYEHHANVLASGKIVNERDMLSDHAGSSRDEIEMRIDADARHTEEIKRTLARVKEERFGGRRRIQAVGHLEREIDPETKAVKRVFLVHAVERIDPIDLPFRGEIKLGWNYSDTFMIQMNETEMRLSQALKLPMHHAGRIEWMNARQFPVLQTAGMRSIVFRANSQTTQQMTTGRWNNTFHLTILEARKTG